MSPNTDRHNVGLLCESTPPPPRYDTSLTVTDATNLYPSQKLFQMDKVYTLKQIYNNELSMDICAVMDGETYSGSLTAPAAATVAHLFQTGYVVKIRITKVNETKPAAFSPRLNRFQAWTHGRGDVWQEADEGNKGDKGNKGFDGQAESKCEFPLGLPLNAWTNRAKPCPPRTAPPGRALPSRAPGLALRLTGPSTGRFHASSGDGRRTCESVRLVRGPGKGEAAPDGGSGGDDPAAAG